MCGIVGILGKPAGFPTEHFLEMRDSLAHRGPDDAGIWESPSGTALLGSRRLAILDLSPSGHQPMQDETGNLVVVFNGEIYNYLELAEELSKKGFHFRSHCDTEVLLKSYQMWGSDCLGHLNGMFAFAIWDEAKQELFAGRDRFGEKPFYFFHDNERELFAFASEIKSLIAGKLFSARPNHHAVYSYLAYRDIDGDSETLFENVFALPAAHGLLFSRIKRSLKLWRYWNLDPTNKIRLPNEKEYAESFLELMADSIRIRLRSDVSVGSSLSGGVDSSTIVGLISKDGAKSGQETFSARFAGWKLDEGTHIDRMNSWAGVRSHCTYPDPERIPEEIDTLTWHQDEPYYSLSIYGQWAVMRLAKESGVTVLLDGQGADEILAGYHGYFTGYYKSLLKQFRLLKFVSSVYRYLIEQGPSLLPLIFSSFLPARLKFAGTVWLKPRGMPQEYEREWRRPPIGVEKKFNDSLQQSLYESLTRTSLPQLLRYADRNSMAFSREVRLPFLDHRLVEFLFAIPTDQIIHGSTTKVVLRNAISGIVPEEIRNRKDKIGFAPPESAWLRGPLRSWASELFHSPEFREREWVDCTAVDSVWQRFLNGEDRFLSSVRRWSSLEIWARNCLKPRFSSQSTGVALIA